MPSKISTRTRASLGALGSISWAAGGVASFMSDNGAGAAGLVVAGVICTAVALIGRWPTRIAMSGNEFAWEEVQETVDTQIAVAEASDDAGAEIAELRMLKKRLETLERTGSVPKHPAEVYDQAVSNAIHRLFPSAELKKSSGRSNQIPDFTLKYRNKEILVETKWRSVPSRPFGGSTLPALLNHLQDGARLLVIANTSVPPKPEAIQLIKKRMDGRGGFVAWQDVGDDENLAAALKALLQS
jgi:hypothetical protein